MSAALNEVGPLKNERLTVAEAAARYGFKESTIIWRIAHNRLPATQINGENFVMSADMDQQPPLVKNPNPNPRPYNKKETKQNATTQKEAQAQPAAIDERDLGHIFGRIEKEIEIYAYGLGVPASELAVRVGELLSGAPRGVRVGSRN